MEPIKTKYQISTTRGAPDRTAVTVAKGSDSSVGETGHTKLPHKQDNETHQGIRAMDSYLFHQYAQDEISKLMDISLQFTQLLAESGREEELLLHPKIPIGYTTSTWTTQLRNFMGMHNLFIECARR
mgnify:CR=1 FL=1